MSTLDHSILLSFRAGIVAIMLDGTVAHVNAIGAKILEGCPLSEGENIIARSGENSFFRLLSEALAMHYLPTRVEVELPGKDGDRQFIGFTLSELKADEKRVGICAFFKDLTHVEMTEENKNLKERLLMLGQMAAGLAHEIRNPIASIGVHCSILRSRVAQDEKLVSSVTMMAREIEKVEYIIRECLNFVRPAELRLQNVRIDVLVEGVISRIKTLYPQMEFSVRKPKEDHLEAEADSSLLEQAITNILTNAVDACDKKGKVDVSFGISRHYNESVRLNRRIEPILPRQSEDEEEFIRINIRDNGPGIVLDIQDRIFVPFFTTKKTGAGIGLPMAQKIIQAHGGILDLDSVPGKGTEFIIKIPVRPKSG